MYGGDEVSAVVIDLGQGTTKAGYAGEDTPKCVFPSSVGTMEAAGEGGSRKVCVNDLEHRREGLEVGSGFKDGVLQDWEVVENIWEHVLKKRLVVASNEHPMLLAEHPNAPPACREKMVELMFEKHSAPAIFLAKDPVLTSFASGRATSLVVDCGASGTTITAVHDGYALQKAAMRSPLGGDLLTDLTLRLTEAGGSPIRPRYMFDRKADGAGGFAVTDVSLPGTTASYHRYRQLEIAADLKESIYRVSDTAFDEAENANMPTMSYELPDGNNVEVGVERFKVPETIFNPSLLSTFPGQAQLTLADGSQLKGITQMILDSITKCDVDVRKELYGGVLLTGGSSLFPSFRERLERELIEASPSASKLKVTASTSTLERRFSVWIGGSILASLGSFQQMWMSRAEYEEHGASLIQRKCP